MKGNNFHYTVGGVGVSVPPQTINAATVNGADIVEPFRIGRQLVFIFLGGTFAVGTDFRLRVFGKRRDTGAYEALLGKDKVTPIEFTQTKLDDGGAGENGMLLGTLYANEVDTETYGTFRVTLQNVGAANGLAGVGHFIADLWSHMSATPDELFEQQK